MPKPHVQPSLDLKSAHADAQAVFVKSLLENAPKDATFGTLLSQFVDADALEVLTTSMEEGECDAITHNAIEALLSIPVEQIKMKRKKTNKPAGTRRKSRRKKPSKPDENEEEKAAE